MPADSIHPSPSNGGAEPVLDPAAIGELRAGGDEFFREIADLFCSETPAQIGRIGRALQSGELDAVRREAHSLKGSSLSMGARRISALCIAIEEAAKQDATARALKFASDLSVAFERVREALQAELKR